MSRLLTTEQAADYLHVSEQTIRSYIKQNVLNAKRSGRRWLIAEEAIEEYLNRSQPPTSGEVEQ